jgi:predicted GH43/DUF377 family glycosyl hydrolase
VQHCCRPGLSAARSLDGITNWQIDAQPTLSPSPEQYPEELWGVDDARIVYLAPLDQYAVTYTAYSRAGPLVALPAQLGRSHGAARST